MPDWTNPIGPGLKPSRVDMGVDYTGTGSLYAMGSGTVVNVYNSGWPGGKFIGLHLDSGQYMYYAENLVPHVSVGQRVTKGQLVATAINAYPFTEIGWAAPPGTGETMAAASGQSAKGKTAGDPGKYSTAYGVSMSDTIKSLGGPAGIITPGGIQGSVGPGFPTGSSTSNSLLSALNPSNVFPGCVPLVGVVWYAVCQAKEFRRNVPGRKRANRRRKDEKRFRRRSRQTT